MRIKVSMGTGEGLLPYNYNHYLAGLLYGAFREADLELAHSLHVSKGIKLYTFSQLMGGQATREGIRFSGQAHFFLSSPRGEVMKAAVEGLLEKGEVKLGRLPFHLESMEVLKDPRLDGREVKFRTLSPINATTKQEKDGRLVQWDLYPTDPRFYENVRRNLVRKHQLLHGSPPADQALAFHPPERTKPVRIEIKGTYHRASHMTFRTRGSKELLEMGYEAGFGEKNSMGFGMVEVVG